MSDVFHLGLKKADLQGATLAIVPGDPERVKRIAELLDNPVHLASHREFTTWRGEMDGKAVIICSTGIGGPSTSIAVEELAQLGINTFLRIGTTGAIQPHLTVGDGRSSLGRRRRSGKHVQANTFARFTIWLADCAVMPDAMVPKCEPQLAPCMPTRVAKKASITCGVLWRSSSVP